MKTIVVALLAALTAVAGATGANHRVAGTLRVNGSLVTTRTGSPSFCPPGTPAGVSNCVRYLGDGVIGGLGAVTSTYTKVIDETAAPDCQVHLVMPVVIGVPGKGTLELSRPGITCWHFAVPINIGPLDFTVSGGSGAYAGATGSLTFNTGVSTASEGARGASFDRWTGTVSVAGLEFDLTEPAVKGAISKTVVAPKGKKRVRVRYAVSAQDAVDGAVPVVCAPASGSFFGLGRTAVTCTATDASANKATARFTVTVKAARR